MDPKHQHHSKTDPLNNTGDIGSNLVANNATDPTYRFPDPFSGSENTGIYAGNSPLNLAVPSGQSSSSTAASPGTNPGSIVGNQGAGLTIIADLDSSITDLQTSNPTLYNEIVGAITTAAQFYENTITNNMTITLDFGYGEIDGAPIAPGAASESVAPYNSFTWSQIYTAAENTLTGPGTSAIQNAAFASLPSTDPTDGNGLFAVSFAEQEALGLGDYSGVVDGWVGISSSLSFSWTEPNNNPDDYDAVGAIEHEISEDLGRVDFLGRDEFGTGQQDYTLLDFFHYSEAGGAANAAPGSAAGSLDEPFAAGYDPSTDGYFSYNGQTITLQYDTPAQVADGDDVADWTNSVQNDSYGFSFNGETEVVSLTDLEELNVLGYDIPSLLPGIVIPTISGIIASQAVSDRGTIAPFANVVIGDANINQTETMMVMLSAGADGMLTNLGGGSYDATTGVYTDTGSATAVTVALDGMVFVPTAGEVTAGQTLTAGFTISVTDTAGGRATATTSLVVVAGTVPPTITGTVADQAVASPGTIAPFANVVIGDDNTGQTETVTVTLSAAANGTLSNLGGGSYNTTAGIYTDTGSAVAVTRDLDDLVFTPTVGEVAVGQSVTTGFTIIDIDTAGGSATDCTTAVVATAVPTQFAMTDTTTGVASAIPGTPYSGPVSGLQWEYITTTSDSLAITATAPDVFIHGGSGGNVIDVSQVNGNNVVDGGDGTNLVIGGAGDDTFFVDDRSPAFPVSDTVANFHSGDAATIWGVTPNDFTLSWVNGQGADGYTGLTLHVTAAGVPTASLTLIGFTTADLTDGKLSVSFGTTAAFDGIPGSTYMYVHAA